jgi:GT2 family glycosyltransferase
MGFAEANNYALARMNQSPWAVCLLNQDTISQPGWIDACIHTLARNPRLGAVTPVLHDYDGESCDPGFLEILPAAFHGDDGFEKMHRQELLLTEAVTAAAMVVRTDVLRKVGPFDPIYGSYYEDYDLCARIRRAGYDLGVCTTAVVRHFSGSATQTEAQRVRRSRQIIRNRAIYDIRFGGGRRAARVAKCLAQNLPQRLVRSLLRTPSSQPLSAVLGATGDLMGLLPRLVSSVRDEREWSNYLLSIDW